MSELNFNVLGNNADLQKESQLLHEAISGLESDFKDLYASAEDSIKGIEQLIIDLRAQIDSTIASVAVDVFHPLLLNIRIFRFVFSIIKNVE